MNLIEVKNLTKKYNNEVALNNVNLNIKKGEFLMILGRSGSGKSTLLHLLAGIDKPSSGGVFFLGKDIYKMKKKSLLNFRRNNISIVYQSYNLFESLSVLENILLPAQISGKDILYEDIVIRLNLSDKLDKLPSSLSGGERQRVALARSLINNPKIILADEPTGNLDPKSRDEIMKLLKKYNKEGRTIVMVTHDYALLKYASRVVKLNDGRVISVEKKINNRKH